MSKLVDALNQVKQERQRQSAPAPVAPVLPAERSSVLPQKRNGSSHFSYAALTASLLVIVATGSVWVNFKTMGELKNTRTLSATMSAHISEQNDELQAIRQDWRKEEAARKNQEKHIAKLDGELKKMRLNLEDLKPAMAKIEDLKTNDKLLLEKFVALNDKVKKLSEVSTVNH